VRARRQGKSEGQVRIKNGIALENLVQKFRRSKTDMDASKAGSYLGSSVQERDRNGRERGQIIFVQMKTRGRWREKALRVTLDFKSP
jgi:hypothetical protein